MIEVKYLTDESKLSGGSANRVLFPKTTEELTLQLGEHSQQDEAVTISAARTGITGGAVPFGGTLISLEKMNNMLGVGYEDKRKQWFLRVQPAVTLIEISALLQRKQVSTLPSLTENAAERFSETSEEYFYPVDPTELGATIGGTIATNASGARSFAYGATREWIKALTVVLVSGEVCHIERGVNFADENGVITFPLGQKVANLKIPGYTIPDVKNSAGLYAKPRMDLIDLFIGSEGILGVISEVEIWLTPKEDELSVIQFFETEEQFLTFVEKIRESRRLHLEFLECIDVNGLHMIRKRQMADPLALDIPLIPDAQGGALFFDLKSTDKLNELENIRNLCNTLDVAPSQSWVAYSAKDKEKLRKFRHALPETVNEIITQRKVTFPKLHKLSTDMSVSDEHLRTIYAFYKEQLNKSGLTYVMFGHIGNNHIHINILPANMDELFQAKALYRTLAKKVVSLGGSLSAEHGIGKIKREYIEIMYGKKGIAEMHRIKQFFDPMERLNKGNVIA